jgi:methyltransferase
MTASLGFSRARARRGREPLVELNISQRRRRALAARGATPVEEPHFGAMVLVHSGILAGCLVEGIAFARPFVPPLAATATALVSAPTSCAGG